MIRKMALVLTLLCLPVLVFGQDTQIKKIMVFPFKIVAKGVPASQLNNEMAGVLGAELSREGDVEVISGLPFASAIQGARIEPQRLVRIAERMGAQAVIWGTASQLEEGIALELSVLPTQDRKSVV